MNLRLAWVSVLGLLACRDPKVSEVLSAYEGKPYVRIVETTKHRIEIRYLPKMYQILARAGLDAQSTLTPRILDSLGTNGVANTGLAFVLNISLKDTLAGGGLANDVVYGAMGGFSDYQHAHEAYRHGLKEKIWLEWEGKRHPMASYTMENSWGMAGSRNFFLVFGYPGGNGPGKSIDFDFVLDAVVPGMARKKIKWTLPTGKYDALIQ